MSDFKAEMHHVRFLMGLRPRPRWGSLQRSPRPSSCIKGGLLLRGRRGKGKRRVGEGKREKGTILRTHCRKFLATPLFDDPYWTCCEVLPNDVDVSTLPVYRLVLFHTLSSLI